ncbi:MAG: glutamyl-tRNA reductase [Melioribacteraceae bacterium]|nr:glutamyl-tRNA reductase [Melioribacteraceae bacterium]MCO6472964.1 glutamyl-tRNA reductase [Melioribacteraceae bacterium]MDD3558731.1 glutamyl-tRNA reductase [Melioribacteraceae bacterium]
MNLIGITINHTTAPIELREAFHLNQDEIAQLIARLKEKLFSEGFILSTCNRTEVFGFPQSSSYNYTHIYEELTNLKKVDGVKPENFKKYFSCGAVKHTFEVASGIDSLLIGDSQILGQLKEAFNLSDDLNFSGSFTKRLADAAIKVGKRAIKETRIGEGAVTISFAAVQVIEKIYASLENKKALVIGAGETAELAAVHIKERGLSEISITNRTAERGKELAQKVFGKFIPFDEYKNQLYKFDIIISATSSDDILISKKEIKDMMKHRRGSSVVLMDIAIPRDIDPSSADIDNVFYHDIDSLKIIVDQNLQRRKFEIPKIKRLIEEELVAFFSWYNTLDIVPTIKVFREFFENIRIDELNKIKNKVTEDDYHKIDDMTRRMIGRLLHNPTITLKELAESGQNVQEAASHALLITNLFKLNETTGKDRLEK